MYTIDEVDLVHWVKLTLLPGLGPIKINRLLAHFGSIQALMAGGAESWHATLGLPLARELHAILTSTQDHPYHQQVQQAIDWNQQDDQHILPLTHPAYPDRLRQISDPPALLYVKGKLSFLDGPALAVVGSRNSTRQGNITASEFCAQLARSGITIVSGLARGIDYAAHSGALKGVAGTIAVAGTGVDVIYPAQHKEMAARIVEHGCLVSEYPLGTGPIRGNFPRRNRIISGLSNAVLVVEAAERSGSLLTGNLAAEQGRNVYAIPGSIHSPLARGCHRLIREGAILVDNVNDILMDFGKELIADSHEAIPRPLLEQNQHPLLSFLAADPISFETLQFHCKMATPAIQAALMELELDGQIEILPSGQIRRLFGS